MVIVAVIVLLLSYNSILRVAMEHNIRAQTGMDAEIGKFSIFGLTSSRRWKFKISKALQPAGLRRHAVSRHPGNPRRIRPRRARRHEIHLTLLRFNLGELDIVKNEAGQTNIFSLGLTLPAKKSGGGGNAAGGFQKTNRFDFKGIDVLNVSVGTAKFIDLKDQRNNREQKIGIENCVMKNVKSRPTSPGWRCSSRCAAEIFLVNVPARKLVDQKSSGHRFSWASF
jgi:hypothetical protein